MVIVRSYKEDDAYAVGCLIADTYGEYNLDFVPPQERGPFLGPFQHARSQDPAQRARVAQMIAARMVFVAENEQREIVGVLRGSLGRLHSLFVRGDHHRRGIGRMLVAHFEQECARQHVEKITLAATLYAVPFYQSVGYKKSTGVRRGWSFEGEGLQWQPMKKVLPWVQKTDV